MAWARFYLAKAGLIDGGTRGVWVLTEKGRETYLTQDAAVDLFKRLHDGFVAERQTARDAGIADDLGSLEEVNTAPDERRFLNEDEVRSQLVTILQCLGDKGFEEFCALLLRHTGFEQVLPLGGSGDRGVDGSAVLTINRFVRTKVMFQCKRYVGSVGPAEIRDFRGAIQGRAERGIFLTTGLFTSGAREEANRENATPIELVDIERLVDLLIEESLGVQEAKALKLNPDFFRAYQPK